MRITRLRKLTHFLRYHCQRGHNQLLYEDVPSSPFAGFSLGAALGGIVSD
jgi:hypothetical protein